LNGVFWEDNGMKRREFLKRGVLTGACLASGSSLLSCSKTHTDQKQDSSSHGYVSLFDGKTLNGWPKAPDLPILRYPGGPDSDTASSNYEQSLSAAGRRSIYKTYRIEIFYRQGF
jgi:hypothetical protein